MNLFNIFGNAFRPIQLDESDFKEFEVETKPCKYCECYHAEDSDFCGDVCEKEYYLKTQGEDTETQGCDRYHADKDEELSNN